MIRAFTSAHAGNWHPLTWISHMLDCDLYGLNPAGHHLNNLLLHLINTETHFEETLRIDPGALKARDNLESARKRSAEMGNCR